MDPPSGAAIGGDPSERGGKGSAHRLLQRGTIGQRRELRRIEHRDPVGDHAAHPASLIHARRRAALTGHRVGDDRAPPVPPGTAR